MEIMNRHTKILGVLTLCVTFAIVGALVKDYLLEKDNILIPFNSAVGITKKELTEILRDNAESIVGARREEVKKLCTDNEKVMDASGINCPEILASPTGPS